MSSDTNTPPNPAETDTQPNPGFNTNLREYVGRLSAATARPTEHLDIRTKPPLNEDGPRRTDKPFVRVTVNHEIEDDDNPTIVTIEILPQIASNGDEEVFFGYTIRVGLSTQNIGKTPLDTIWYDSIDWEALGVGNPSIRAFNGTEHSNTETFDFGFKSNTSFAFSDAIDTLCDIMDEIRAHQDEKENQS